MQQILCYGDSNTWGLMPGTKQRFSWGIRWTSILQEKLEKFDIRIIEDGLVGRTTVFDDKNRKYRNSFKELPMSLEVNEGVETIVLMLGTNDCKTEYHASPEQIGVGIEILISQIRVFNPEIEILLVSPILLGDDVWKEQFDPEFDQNSVKVSKCLKEVYQKVAASNGVEFLAASDFAVPSSVDMEHMDAIGHRSMANAVYKKLMQMILGINEAAA